MNESWLRKILEQEKLLEKVDAILTDQHRYVGPGIVGRPGTIKAQGLDWEDYLMYHNIEVNDAKIKEWDIYKDKKSYNNKKKEKPKVDVKQNIRDNKDQQIVENNQNNNINKEQVNKERETDKQNKPKKNIKKKDNDNLHKKISEIKNFDSQAYDKYIERMNRAREKKNNKYNTKDIKKIKDKYKY